MLNKEFFLKLGLIGAGGVLTLVLVLWISSNIQNRRAIRDAEAALQKGFPAVAAERLEERRHALISHDRGCQVMLGAYFRSRRLERLEWAAEACLEANKNVLDAFLALAAHRELTNRDTEALSILSQAAPRFEQVPDVYFRMGQIFQRAKNKDAATSAYLKAAERIPGANQMTMEILSFFSSIQKWPEARAMADRLKSITIDEPEVKLIIARALKNGGDPAGAEAVVEQARSMLSSRPPEFAAALQATYADVLGKR